MVWHPIIAGERTCTSSLFANVIVQGLSRCQCHNCLISILISMCMSMLRDRPRLQFGLRPNICGEVHESFVHQPWLGMLAADDHASLHLSSTHELVCPPVEMSVLLHVQEGACLDTTGVRVPEGAEELEPGQARHVSNGIIIAAYKPFVGEMVVQC
eukprot:402783-Prorocentrum_minimum.AAC.2